MAFGKIFLAGQRRVKSRAVKIYHLLTESEVITGKSQTEALRSIYQG